jgi:aspartate/methionine/tyrosine aminotransferase
MPRFPDYSPPIAAMPSSVYSALAHRLSIASGETYPLHVGDTWMEPPEGCRMEDVTVARYPGVHRYAPVQGLPELIRAICRRVEAKTGQPTANDEVLVTAGATGGLGAVIGGLLAPGDEVLILAPYWPLIGGIVTSFHGKPVPVDILGASNLDQLVALAKSKVTDRTIALYLNTPNNPTGRVLPRAWVEALVAFAKAHDLWVISDEVYEDYVYEGEHTYARPLAPERTFSAYSFSKAWGMAGNRAGFVVGPAGGIDQLRKVSTHTFYSTPTAAQIVALRALEGPGDAWARMAAAQYRETGSRAADRLGVAPPQGSTFLFLDVEPFLDDRGLPGFLERCVDQNLLLAPGPAFGPYKHHVRLCFTCSPPEVVLRGIDRLAPLMGR